MARFRIPIAIALLSVFGSLQSGGPTNPPATQPAANQPASTEPAAEGQQSTTQPAEAVVDPDLVGMYYTGDGLGYNLSLTFGADGTFSCTWRGCLGVYGTASGTWSRLADRVNFAPQEATDMLRNYLRGATVVGGGEFPALVLDQHLKFYQKHGRSRFSALQRIDRSGWIDDPPPLPPDERDPSTRPRKSWLRRLFTGEI